MSTYISQMFELNISQPNMQLDVVITNTSLIQIKVIITNIKVIYTTRGLHH